MNVKFLKGSQEKFNSLTSFTPGAFYLTEDSGRLYYASTETATLDLNKYVIQVATMDALPTTNIVDGDFYYIKDKNILCTRKNGAWVQINPDTNDNDTVAGLTIEKTSASVDGGIVYTYTLTQKDKSGSLLDSKKITGTFKIDAADVATLGGIAVAVGATVTTNKATINTSGSGASGSGFTVSAGDNVTIGGSANALTISATDTTYGIASAANATTIVLTDSNSSAKGTITFAGDDKVVIDGTTANQIKYTHATSGATAGSYGNATNQTPAYDKTFNVPYVTVDDTGHVTSIKNTTVKMPASVDTTYSIKGASTGESGITADDTGTLTVHLVDQDGGDSGTTSGKILYNTITVDGTKTTVYNQNDLGSFYSASEVDKKLNAIDSMTYKGTLGGTSATVTTLPSTGVKVGDTYKVAAAGTYAGTSAAIGDLYVATGTEDSTGVITSGLAWTYIPSGSDADTTYTVSVGGSSGAATVGFKDNVTTNSQTVTIKNGTATTVTPDATNKAITIAHADVSHTATDTSSKPTSLAYGDTIKTVTGVTVNSQGHVTDVSTAAFTLPASVDTTYELVADTTNNRVQLKDSGTNTDGSIKVAGGTSIGVTMSSDTSKNHTFTVTHSDVTRTDGSTEKPAALAYSGTFTAVTGVTTNSQGHVTTVATKEYTLPASVDTTYTLADTVAVATASGKTTGTHTINLTDNSSAKQTATFSVASSSLTVAADGTKGITMDLEWGSF
jgi:hypothetical protein